MVDKYKEIGEFQDQTLLDSKLKRFVGANSNQIGKLANQASRIMMENTKRINKRDTVPNNTIAVDTSERDDAIKNGRKLIQVIEKKIADYNSAKIYRNKMKDMYNKLKSEKKILGNSVDGIVATIQTNNRRFDYQTPELEWLMTMRVILIIVFFMVGIYSLNRINFVGRGLYKNYRAVALVIICGAFPFFVSPIVALFSRTWLRISNYIDNRITRNVYVDI